MLTGREILGIYSYAEAGEALGHQHEYTMKQMLWQVAEAGLEIVSSKYYQDGFKGSNLASRLAWLLVSPISLVPYIRNGLVMVLRRP